MRPLDPRLLRHARAARSYVVLTAGLGLLTTALVVAQALLLADVIAAVAMEHRTAVDVRTPLLLLVGLLLARAATAGVQERFGHRAATVVIQQLRRALLERVADRTREKAGDQETARVAVLATRGLDDLTGYLTRYLPQLLLAATLTPAVLAVISWQDTIAGVTVALTLPLIPLFMALVGLTTQASADRSLRTLQRLSAQILDLIAGLPTLRALGQAARPLGQIREVGEAHRRTTMRTLRTAFLSALVLETLTTLSVALVAVGIGLRLVHGGLDLRTGLSVLLLAPEVYLPLRQVGVHFHASVDGLAAAGQAFEVLDQQADRVGALPAPDLRVTTIRFEGVNVVHPGTDRATPTDLDAEIRPGEIVALVGASGTGKSSAAAVLLGLRRPDRGRVTLCSTAPGPEQLTATDLNDIEPASWWAQLAWVPQHPALIPGSLADNVRLTAPEASDSALERAAAVTGLDVVVSALTDRWSAKVGQGGVGLSAGQRQRLALTRALLSDAPLVVLDEPTAHLDAGAEQAVLAVLGQLRRAGRTVVVVAHRPALIALADRVVSVSAGHREPSLVSA
jgi:ATP-binding cassette, subfamily C, bacterial CydD